MENQYKEVDKALSKVACGKARKRKYTLLEASAKYLGVKKPKYKY